MKKSLLLLSCLSVSIANVTLAQANMPAGQAVPRYQFAQQSQASLVPEQAQVAAEPASSRQRLTLIGRLDTLQTQLRDMQGQLEKQQHQMQQLQIAQREMYADLDKRIKNIHGNGTNASSANNTAAPAQPQQAAKAQNANDILNQQQIYQKAYDQIRSRRYTEAQTALQNYLQQYPNGEYAVNAHYWLGELGLLSGNAQVAAQEFSVVVTKYPKSQKVPDATLKLGFLAYDQSQWSVAKKYLKDVETKYPNSSAAKLANQRLQQMSREGH